MQAPQENPYNGGLIDFHESALRSDLGTALYAHQLAAHQAQYAASQYPAQAQGLAPVHHMHPQAQAYAPQYQAPLQPQFAPPSGALPAVQSMMMSQAPGQCIAGPPAFLHLHGKVYAPIEESVVPAAEPAALKESPASVQSGKALDRLVEQRVEQRVNEYFSKNKPKGLGASMRKRQPAGKPDSLKELNGAMRARLSAY
jgi:hypothetical protein